MITESEDEFVISAPHLVVTTCCRDAWSSRLELRSDDEMWTLIIGGTFSLSESRAEVSTATAQPLEVLVGKVVSDVRSRKSDGELEIRFSDGVLLRVGPDPDYEAWEMYSTRGERLIAVPGDGIAKWGESRQ